MDSRPNAPGWFRLPVQSNYDGTLREREEEPDEEWDPRAIYVSPDHTDGQATAIAYMEEYNRYVNGEVYSYSVIRVDKCETCGHPHAEIVDSCTGFDYDTARSEGAAALAYHRDHP